MTNNIAAGRVTIDAAVVVPGALFQAAVATLGAELIGGNTFVTLERVDAVLARCYGG